MKDGAAGIIVTIVHGELEHFLLCKRQEGKGVVYAGMWSIPGGAIEDGEKPEEAAVVDKTGKVITPRKKRTAQDQFIQKEIKVEKASPYLFEYVTPQSVANFNNNPINRGLPEDTNFIKDNSYLSSRTFTNDPVTFYNGRPFKTGKGIQTFSPLVRALNNYPDYNNIKTKKIISPRNIWKHLSSSTVNKKQSLAFTGGEKLFAYKTYQWFWEKGFIPDDHEIKDIGNTLLDADEYYNVIENI